MFDAYKKSVYGPKLRYPHPPLNQSSYTNFSFHDWPSLPHPASYFFVPMTSGSFPPRDWNPVISTTIFPIRPKGPNGARVEAAAPMWHHAVKRSASMSRRRGPGFLG